MTSSTFLRIACVLVLGSVACSPSGSDDAPKGTPIVTGMGGSGGSSSGGGVAGSMGGGSGRGSVGTGNGGTGGASGMGGDVTTSGSGGAGGTMVVDPVQAVEMGVMAYENGDYATAIMQLEAAIAADPDGPAAAAATFFIARSQQQLDDCTMALDRYRTFLEQYPDDEKADDAQFRIGQCYYQTADYANALVELQKVLDDYAGDDAANDAQYTIGLVYLAQAIALTAGAEQDGLLAQARGAFQVAIDDYPDRSDGTTSPNAQLGIALTYEVVGDCATELTEMQKVLSDYPIDANADPDVSAQRQSARDEAQVHIDDLGLATPANHTCL